MLISALVSSNNDIVTLTWTFNSSCLPASTFNIFHKTGTVLTSWYEAG
jgi:hypothetical protein